MKKSAALFVAFIATLIQNPISAQPRESTTITTTTTTTTVTYVAPDETQGVDYMPKSTVLYAHDGKANSSMAISGNGSR